MATLTLVLVVVCPVGGPPYVHEIVPSTDDLEQLLGGGTADVFPVSPGVGLWCNEDAEARGMAPNRDVPGIGFVRGPFVLACETEEGDLVSFTAERAAELVALADSWPTLPASYGRRS